MNIGDRRRHAQAKARSGDVAAIRNETASRREFDGMADEVRPAGNGGG
jgi:hypothetical protein